MAWVLFHSLCAGYLFVCGYVCMYTCIHLKAVGDQVAKVPGGHVYTHIYICANIYSQFLPDRIF